MADYTLTAQNLRLSSILFVVAVSFSALFLVIGLSAPNWIEVSDLSHKSYSYLGLWKYCLSTSTKYECEEYHCEVFKLKAYRWLAPGKPLMIISFLLVLPAIIAGIINIFRGLGKILFIIMGCLIVAGIFGIAAASNCLATYFGNELVHGTHGSVGFSVYLSYIGSVLALVSAGLGFLTFKQQVQA